ncbi:hypothetical protein H0H93_010415 [Arthromyces matolae]|nr:hypothetical protein H0H93_010415 [Arthromyces matolae]
MLRKARRSQSRSGQRLYTLDRQVNQDHSEILENLGAWLLRRSQHASQKRVASEAVLTACQHPEAFLRDQWKKQVEAQTKPLPRQSKNAGEKAVNELIRLREQRDELKKREHDFDNILRNTSTPQDIHDDTLVELDKIRSCFKELTSKIRTKESALGVQERLRLQRWIKSEYITTLMKLRALKLRLRDKLRARKFELDRVERSFRHQVNNQRINEHTEASVKRRDPSITQLATKYNKLCDTLADLIKKKKAPPRSVCPRKIEVKGLFSLDVDDTIWEDVGLNKDDVEPPAWLADQAVRDGIKALLEHDRCLEEDIRLRHECRSMRFWLSEEWRIVNMAIDSSRDWGPSISETVKVRASQITESVRVVREEDEIVQSLPVNAVGEDDSDDDEDDGDNVDEILFETLDAVDLADAYRTDPTL